MRPVTDLPGAFDERHGFIELALGLWSVLRPLVGARRFAPDRGAPARPAPLDEEDDVLALLLGFVSFAWHLEVLFQDRAPTAVAAAPDDSAPERLFR